MLNSNDEQWNWWCQAVNMNRFCTNEKRKCEIETNKRYGYSRPFFPHVLNVRILHNQKCVMIPNRDKFLVHNKRRKTERKEIFYVYLMRSTLTSSFFVIHRCHKKCSVSGLWIRFAFVTRTNAKTFFSAFFNCLFWIQNGRWYT